MQCTTIGIDIAKSVFQLSVANIQPVVQQFMTIPGIGVSLATAVFGSVPDIHQLKRARQFNSWLGLTPRELVR